MISLPIHKTDLYEYVKDICNLLSDENVVIRKTDALLRVWKRYPYRHNLSFLSLCISSLCLCKYDDIVLMLFPSFSYALSLTHLSVSVSPLASSLSPPLCFAYKPIHAKPFWLIIDCNKVIWKIPLFHLKGWTQYMGWIFSNNLSIHWYHFPSKPVLIGA